MGILHFTSYLKHSGANKEVPSLRTQFQKSNIGTIIIDVIPMFKFLLRRYAYNLFRAENDNNQYAVDKILDLFTGNMLAHVKELIKNSPRKACLVLDGDYLRAMDRKKYINNGARCEQMFKLARKLLRDPHVEQKHKRITEIACQWVSFTNKYKMIIINHLRSRGIYQLDRNDKKNVPKLFYVRALAEAAPEIVVLARMNKFFGKTAILSPDPHLFAYRGALGSLRVLKIDWNSPDLQCIVTSKIELLHCFKLIYSNDETPLEAENRLAVLISVGGNYYADKPESYGVETIKKIMISGCERKSATKANVLLEGLLNCLNMPEKERIVYRMALHQFGNPLINSNNPHRTEGLVMQINCHIQKLVDGAPDYFHRDGRLRQ
ncbi:hypothetical protein BDA99DRAFT_522517 [Phascolomyces articulosus]|uniref:Uncharacterized protein n=1 Tax=Phascolomyces articulosus TaxID=60185 RepID=A0AAD5P9G5_9FUNG|nr:hypothetical protein BDA99DRAFT_522517 [Phascolomyces articulosus]